MLTRSSNIANLQCPLCILLQLFFSSIKRRGFGLVWQIKLQKLDHKEAINEFFLSYFFPICTLFIVLCKVNINLQFILLLSTNKTGLHSVTKTLLYLYKYEHEPQTLHIPNPINSPRHNQLINQLIYM